MPKYLVTMKSQTDDQRRYYGPWTADSPEAAIAHCEDRERENAAFQLEMQHEDHESYLTQLDSALATNDAGKVVVTGLIDQGDGTYRVPNKRDKARWHLHHQSLPYVLESVEEVA